MIVDFNKFVNENKLILPNIPNTMNFWHGGNLNEYSEVIAHKNGRYEYGAGLYLTTRYDVAKKYAKGSRKLYIITIEYGNDINDSFLDIETSYKFIDKYILASKRKLLKERILNKTVENKFPAYILNNNILNEKAIKASNTGYLREFLTSNNIDYDIVENYAGFGDDMMVLYNMNKIVNTIQFKSSDELDNYNFKNKK